MTCARAAGRGALALQGPSDSEGAVIKTSLRAAEDRSSYFADTEAAFVHLVKNRRIERGTVSVVGKQRHTIGSREFMLVKVGTLCSCMEKPSSHVMSLRSVM